MKPLNISLVFCSFLLLLFFSCSGNPKPDKKGYFSEEKFVDSLNVGRKGKTKVEIEKFRHVKNGDVFVTLNFYDLKDIWVETKGSIFHTWELKNSFKFIKDGVTGLDVQISDFNNDGFNDMTYQSGIAGRGGNIVMTLFLYEPKNKDFIHIKNSDNYPNLSFNSKLNCINSVILTGSTTTAFLKIKKDSLDEFARVDVSDKIVVEEKDSTGKFKIIEEKLFKGKDDDFYKIFRNYKPLEY
ncbi:XAC2610-related protein [Chryseobacterium sp. R2ACT005]|uniref:XAC2610-related protein n=1 Tax=Chryseobacterium sp. R2ACT005 TaxID=3416668 RepID=UPI003CF71A66